jgi:CheY-like chemotaxis protein
MLLKDLLSQTGFEVVEASDGREAVKKYKESTPDLVFLDMRMPVMDGYAAIKKIKSLQKVAPVPVIAVTASAFDVNRKKMIDAGIDGYIRKPYKIQEIYAILKSKLGVRYTYAKTPAGRADKAGKITKETLRGLPENLAGRMLEAAVRVDLDRLLELIDEAAKASPALSAKLRVMAKSFRYDELINLLKKRGKI